MTARTRWDALAEELAGKPEDQAPDDGPEFKRIDRTTTIVVVNGAAIQTTGLSLDWSRYADAELVRLGVLSDEAIRPPTVSGSFSTTTDANLRPNDEVLIMIVRDDVLRFVVHVTGVRWSNAKFGVAVDFVGFQVS